MPNDAKQVERLEADELRVPAAHRETGDARGRAGPACVL